MNRVRIFVVAILFYAYTISDALAVPSLNGEANTSEDETKLDRSTKMGLDHVSLRTPTCFSDIKSLPSPSGQYPSHFFFAADNDIKVYINGAPAFPTNKVSNWNYFGMAFNYVKEGDVISVIAKDFGVWYGAIAAIHFRGRFYATGIHDWRAKRENPGIEAWMSPGFNGCSWPLAQVLPGAGTYNPGKSPHFPYYTGAKYVWAADARQFDTIYMRHVVGNTCR